MNKLVAILLVACSGCASFTTTQTDETAKDGTRRITTKIKTRTLFDSKSELAKLKASTTEKTQTIAVGSINQESSGSNVVNLVEATIHAAVTAAAKAAIAK